MRRLAVADDRALRAIEFMKANLSRTLTVAGIAAATHSSASRLSHVFVQETGMTVGEALSRLRVERGAELLVMTDLSVKEVAVEAGFKTLSGANVFGRLFKSLKGVPPATYRRMMRRAQFQRNEGRGEIGASRNSETATAAGIASK